MKIPLTRTTRRSLPSVELDHSAVACLRRTRPLGGRCPSVELDHSAVDAASVDHSAVAAASVDHPVIIKRNFYYTKIPYLLFSRTEDEYHIHLSNLRQRAQRFKGNTGKYFHHEIMDFFKQIWKKRFDEDYDFDREWYIYIHVPSGEEGLRIVKDLVNQLNQQYEMEWSKHVIYVPIPSLVSILHRKMKDEKYFAEAIIEHQNQLGYEQTKKMIKMYFDKCIDEPRYEYEYEYDSDGY